MSWLFSQALVEEYSQATCSAGEQSAQLNVMPTPQPFWRNDKTMGPCRLSRFGVTSRLLTDTDGETVLMSFLADFPARISALRVVEPDLTASARASGASSAVLLAKWNPDTSTWKTAQRSLLGDSDDFSETWPRAGSMRNGACYLRPMLEPLTCARESGFWPTPNVSRGRQSIAHAEQIGRSFYHNGKKVQLGLEAAVKLKGEQLPNAVGATLNPWWVELLMGWPLGWTDLKPLVASDFSTWHGRWEEDWEGDTPRTLRCAHRAHRINALGNGQVPLCAAMAWIQLYTRSADEHLC